MSSHHSSFLWRTREPWQVVGIAQREPKASPEVPWVLCFGEVLNYDARLLANDHAEKAPLNERKTRNISGNWVVGPCIVPAYCLIALNLLTPLFMFLLGFFTAHQTSTDGMLQYSLWVWLPFLVLLLLHLRLEFKILTYILIPKLQVVGNYKVFGLDLGFSCWFAYAFMLSAINFIGLATVSLFMAIHAVQHDEHWSFWCPWWLAWFLNFMPAAWVLLTTMPKWGQWQAGCGEGNEKAIEYRVSASGRYHYGTWLGETMATGSLIGTLMEGTGSASLTDSGISLPAVSAKNLTFGKAAGNTVLSVKRSLQHLRSTVPVMFFRILAAGLLKTSLQAQVQISALKLQVKLHPDETTPWRELFSISVSLLGIIPLLMTMITNERCAMPVASRLRAIIRSLPATGVDQAEIEGSFRCLMVYKWMIRAAGIFVLFSILKALFHLLAVVFEGL